MKKTEPVWFLYVVRCCDNSLYTGITTDVRRRIAEHRGKGKNGAKYLRGKSPLRLVYKRRIGTRSEALKAEHRVKRMKKGEKEAMVRSGNK
jgi:putative endonuclease